MDYFPYDGLVAATQKVRKSGLTEDASTLYKYCERLRIDGCIKLKAIKLKDGFDPGVFGVLG